jgi:hypothetical protein
VHGEQSPRACALEFVFASVFEANAGAGDQQWDSTRDDELVRASVV